MEFGSWWSSGVDGSLTYHLVVYLLSLDSRALPLSNGVRSFSRFKGLLAYGRRFDWNNSQMSRIGML